MVELDFHSWITEFWAEWMSRVWCWTHRAFCVDDRTSVIRPQTGFDSPCPNVPAVFNFLASIQVNRPPWITYVVLDTSGVLFLGMENATGPQTEFDSPGPNIIWTLNFLTSIQYYNKDPKPGFDPPHPNKPGRPAFFLVRAKIHLRWAGFSSLDRIVPNLQGVHPSGAYLRSAGFFCTPELMLNKVVLDVPNNSGVVLDTSGALYPW
ncbi:hypothetical protein DFH08DRAFT_814506 [Mycena albidolilacea]|uniref:Uncharacterized protein n=1 Tax=Mycena albidolilacea TaxID=1033008 RepID=A0AAD6ZQU4_9AGAR|nr:hypothetical protein DFH08DRAFT_814506 [Mycena albidolilacea]